MNKREKDLSVHIYPIKATRGRKPSSSFSHSLYWCNGTKHCGANITVTRFFAVRHFAVRQFVLKTVCRKNRSPRPIAKNTRVQYYISTSITFPFKIRSENFGTMAEILW